jgi:hypothetical protein
VLERRGETAGVPAATASLGFAHRRPLLHQVDGEGD